MFHHRDNRAEFNTIMYSLNIDLFYFSSVFLSFDIQTYPTNVFAKIVHKQ